MQNNAPYNCDKIILFKSFILASSRLSCDYIGRAARRSKGNCLRSRFPAPGVVDCVLEGIRESIGEATSRRSILLPASAEAGKTIARGFPLGCQISFV